VRFETSTAVTMRIRDKINMRILSCRVWHYVIQQKFIDIPMELKHPSSS